MKTQFVKTVLAIAITAQVLFAQEIDTDDEEPEPQPAFAVALPKPVEKCRFDTEKPKSQWENRLLEKQKADAIFAIFRTAMSVSLVTGGLAAIIYGITQNGEVSRYVDDKNAKAAVNAERNRNIGYGVGATLFAGGFIFYLAF